MTCPRCGHTPPAGSPFCNGCAQALVEIHSGKLDEQAALLAHHFESAGEVAEAVRWHERAATWLEGHDPKAGLHHWEQLVELVGAKPESADPARVALRACVRIIDLGVMLGLDFARGEGLYRRGRAIAARFEEPDLEAALIVLFARLAAMGDESLPGFEMADEALRVAPRVSDHGRYTDLIVAASTTLATAGRIADAIATLEQAALARAALADALVRAVAPEHEIAAAITEARELVRKSGGNSLLPRLREAEARLAGRNDRTILDAGLREAEAMYRAMGAPDSADRLARELAA